MKNKNIFIGIAILFFLIIGVFLAGNNSAIIAFFSQTNSSIDPIEGIALGLANPNSPFILVTNALHLDENRKFILDIYDSIRSLDGNWSEAITNSQYVRVTFEKNLTSKNDITIYPRTVNGTPKIEVYENSGSHVVAEFKSITDNELNKVYLTNLNGSQDSFDLKILNGSVEFDYIVDPDEYPTFSNYFDNTGTLWNQGLAYFSTSVNNTNGTVWLNINNTNITANGRIVNVKIVNVSAHNMGPNAAGSTIYQTVIGGMGMNGVVFPDQQIYWPPINTPNTWNTSVTGYQNEFQTQATSTNPVGTGLLPITSINGKRGWFAFDLGETVHSLDKMYLWNARESNDRGFKNFSVYYATSPSVLPTGPINPATNTTLVDYNFSGPGWTKLNVNHYVLPNFTISPAIGGDLNLSLNNISARYIAIEIITPNVATQTRIGMAEVGITKSGYSANYTFPYNSNGSHNYNWYAYNTTGDVYNISSSRTYTVKDDTLIPRADFTSPTKASGSISNVIQINITANDTQSGVKNITIRLYNSTSDLINTSVASFAEPTFLIPSIVSYTRNYTGLIDNMQYFYNATACDFNNNCNNTVTRNITVDLTNPTLTFENPTDTSGSLLQDRNYILVNVSSIDTNLANISVRLYDAFRIINITNVTTTASSLYLNLSRLPPGVYYFNATAIDRAGNVNNSETRNVTIDYNYPIFSNFIDNSATLINPGIANFSAFVNFSNGTVFLNINNTNYTAFGSAGWIRPVNASASNNRDNFGGNLTDLYTYEEMYGYGFTNDPATWRLFNSAYWNAWIPQTTALINRTTSSENKIAWVTYDLGVVYNISRLWIWNQRSSAQKVTNFSIWYTNNPLVAIPGASTTATIHSDYNFTAAGWTNWNGTTTNIGQGLTPAADAILTTNFSARYVAIIIHNSTSTTAVGINEFAVEGNRIFNVSLNLTVPGTYPYYWWSYGNGPMKLYNQSEIRSYEFSDTLAPNATILNQNNTFTNNTAVNFTLNVSDNVGLSNSTLNIYNSTGLYNSTTVLLGGVTQTTVGIVVSLAEGIYNWFWDLFDLAGNLFSTQNTTVGGPGNFTITEDLVAPFWSTPAINESLVYWNSTIRFNTTWNSSPADLSSARLYINQTGSFVAHPVLLSGSINISEHDILINANAGTNVTWYFWANDSAGNSNQTDLQSFIVYNRNTSFLFGIANSSYARGFSDYLINIPLEIRYVDTLTGNPISSANCNVTNDKDSQTIYLVYNSTTGNYTGLINDQNLYDIVNFTATCSKDNYISAQNYSSTQVIYYLYLTAMSNLSYGSNGSMDSYFLRKLPPAGPMVNITESIPVSVGTNLVRQFYVYAEGVNGSFTRDLSIIGLRYLRLNVTINDSVCKPYLTYAISDDNLNTLYEEDEFTPVTIPSDTPTLLEFNYTDPHTILHNQYFSINYYLNCSAASNILTTVFLNNSNLGANFEISNLQPTGLITDTVYYNIPANYVLGPGNLLNIARQISVSLNNTYGSSRESLYRFFPQVLSIYDSRHVPNSAYIYNSTGDLWASDNVSAGAPNNVSAGDDNSLEFMTEEVPANSAVIMNITRGIKAVSDSENLVIDLNVYKEWIINTLSIFIPSVPVQNVTVYTNYSTYNVPDDWNFSVALTNSTGTFDISSEIMLDTNNKTLTFPATTLIMDEVSYHVTARDLSLPNATILNQNNTFTNNTAVNFTLNVSDNVGLSNSTLNIYNSTGLYNSTTVLLGGVTQTTVGIVVSLAEGIYNWFWDLFDLAGNLFSTQNTTVGGQGNFSIVEDTTSPQIEIISPINNSYNDVTILVNLSVIDSAATSIWFDANGTNQSYSSETYANFSQGSNTLIVYANDSAGNVNSSSTIFFVDSIFPTIEFATPSEINGSFLLVNNILVNVSSNDLNFANITINLYNLTELINSTISYAADYFVNFTNLPDGEYYFNASVCDTVGNCNNSATRRVNVLTIYPLYSDYLDNNGSMYYSGNETFNVTILNTNGTAWLEVENTNITALSLGANKYSANHTFTHNGTYTYRWWSYDPRGIYSNPSAIRDYYVNPPELFIESITVNSNISSGENATLEARIYGLPYNISSIIVQVNNTLNQLTNYSMILKNSSNFYNAIFKITNSGNYYFKIYANDTNGTQKQSSWINFLVNSPSAMTFNERIPNYSVPYAVIAITAEINNTDLIDELSATIHLPSEFVLFDTNTYPQNQNMGNISAGTTSVARWYVTTAFNPGVYTINITWADKYGNIWQGNLKNITVTYNTRNSTTEDGTLVFITSTPEIEIGGVYRSEISLKNSLGNYVNASEIMMTMLSSTGAAVLGPVSYTTSGNQVSTGRYNFTYQTVAGQPAGYWTLVANVSRGNNYFEGRNIWRMTGGPFDVRNISIVDSIIQNLGISVILENTGGANQDMTVVWNLTRTDTDDQLISGSETVLVPANSEKLYSFYPSTDYVGEVKISIMGYYSGTEKAGAFKIFNTQQEILTPTSGGGAGGGGGMVVPIAGAGNIREGMTTEGIVCDYPYIRHGKECCLDENMNNICDIDEKEKPVEEQQINKMLSSIEKYFSKLTDKIWVVRNYLLLILAGILAYLIIRNLIYKICRRKKQTNSVNGLYAKEVYTETGHKLGIINEIYLGEEIQKIDSLMIELDKQISETLRTRKILIDYSAVKAVGEFLMVSKEILERLNNLEIDEKEAGEKQSEKNKKIEFYD